MASFNSRNLHGDSVSEPSQGHTQVVIAPRPLSAYPPQLTNQMQLMESRSNLNILPPLPLGFLEDIPAPVQLSECTPLPISQQPSASGGLGPKRKIRKLTATKSLGFSVIADLILPKDCVPWNDEETKVFVNTIPGRKSKDCWRPLAQRLIGWKSEARQRVEEPSKIDMFYSHLETGMKLRSWEEVEKYVYLGVVPQTTPHHVAPMSATLRNWVSKQPKLKMLGKDGEWVDLSSPSSCSNSNVVEEGGKNLMDDNAFVIIPYPSDDQTKAQFDEIWNEVEKSGANAPPMQDVDPVQQPLALVPPAELPSQDVFSPLTWPVLEDSADKSIWGGMDAHDPFSLWPYPVHNYPANNNIWGRSYIHEFFDL